jgi:hypothetical protein
MSEHDSFEDRLRAMADRSASRYSGCEVDLEEFADRYGIDAERARAYADAAGQRLNDRLSTGEPFFDQNRHGDRDSAVSPDLDALVVQGARTGQPPDKPRIASAGSSDWRAGFGAEHWTRVAGR